VEAPAATKRLQVLATLIDGQWTTPWLTTNHGLIEDNECPVESGEMPLYLVMSSILLRRLTPMAERQLLTGL
jgi:hypothetical protein